MRFVSKRELREASVSVFFMANADQTTSGERHFVNR